MRRSHIVMGLSLLLFLSAAGPRAFATPPVLVSAVSRMSHASAGSFDVMLPLSGGSGIECRSVAGGMLLVVTFDQAVTGGTAAVTGGTAAVVGNPTFSGSTMSVSLNGITDAQTFSLTLSNMTNAGNETLASAAVPFRTLFGDVNGDGALNGADVNICRAAVASSAPVNAGNFRSDVSVDGILNGSDVNQIRAAVAAGASVAGGPTYNTPPTISTIATQSVVTGTLMTVGFTVGDAESPATALTVMVTSSDQVTIPNANISTSGTGASRTLSLTPAAGVTAVTPVTITMTVSDGLTSTQATFTVNVTPPATVYLATLSPIAGTGSLGTGTATLTVSGDMTYATLVYSYSNLSSNDTDDAVYGQTTGVMYDIPAAKAQGNQQPNGSYLWTFNAAKSAAILASIQSNTSYMLLESANFPAGELQGTFKLVSGSQTFTPPAAPPSITINPPTPVDASRFMQQAAFGGNSVEIAALSNANASNASTALNDWLTAQFAAPGPIYPTYAATKIAPTTQPLTAQSTTQPYTASSMYYQIYNRVTTAQSPNVYGDTLNDDRMEESWFKNAVTAPDELRQRIATAYSELFVVSEIDTTIDGNIPGLASYYDMLADDAFVNFRQLLGDVTLHPVMGNYLNMQGNNKTAPNENYAREVMQLFTIGLYMLQPDGTLMLDSNGLPIPTYTQPLVTSFAAVYTGWNTSTAVTIPELVAPVAPSTQPTVSNFNSYYQIPMALTASNHSTVAKTLLNYPGAATYPAATQPAYIPATTSQTTATATAELNFALDNIFNHPNTGPFVARMLIQRLVESNPSPAYVYRVAQVFNNDGTGVRGNMKAVITAILTDYEARSPSVRSDAGYGHMREPLIRIADILHSCNAVSKSGKWTIGKTDTTLAQTIFRSPTVFNFFDPAYTQPGVIQAAGLVSPEFDIIYETTITNAQNMIYTGIYAGYSATGAPLLTGTGFRGDAYGSDVYLDFSTAGSGLVSLATTSSGGSSSAMLNQVVLLLSGGPLDSTGTAQARIQTFLNTLPNTNPLAQVQAAVHLVATSSQCAAEK
jgi:uncharacterized protein (DUF1800 family)